MSHETSRKVWAKTATNGILKPHPYCNKCGVLKNVSSDRGKSISYFIMTLSKIRKTLRKRGYKISEAQIRLIVNELSETEVFNDVWWVTYSKQKEVFVSVVKKYVRVSKYLIESLID